MGDGLVCSNRLEASAVVDRERCTAKAVALCAAAISLSVRQGDSIRPSARLSSTSRPCCAIFLCPCVASRLQARRSPQHSWRGAPHRQIAQPPSRRACCSFAYVVCGSALEVVGQSIPVNPRIGNDSGLPASPRLQRVPRRIHSAAGLISDRASRAALPRLAQGRCAIRAGRPSRSRLPSNRRSAACHPRDSASPGVETNPSQGWQPTTGPQCRLRRIESAVFARWLCLGSASSESVPRPVGPRFAAGFRSSAASLHASQPREGSSADGLRGIPRAN